MNIADLTSTLDALISQEHRLASVLLLGPPGVGKTALVSQVAAKHALPVMSLALPTCEAVDLRGIPQVVDGRTRWASPLPREGRGVLLLDELSSAPPDVQVAAHHIVWAESGSDMSLPSGWHIILTGNRATDKTLFRQASAPLRNRLVMLNVEPDALNWIEWAKDANIHPHIIGFIRWRPELLATKEVPAEGAFPSPRSWAQTSSLLSLNVSLRAEREILIGTIGEGPSAEFAAYLRTARELPTIKAIKDDPAHAPIPNSPSLLYALISLLSSHTRLTGEGLMAYCMRLQAEFALLYIKDIRDRYDLRKDEEVRVWIAKHKNLFSLDD